jgi:hypothetical protein
MKHYFKQRYGLIHPRLNEVWSPSHGRTQSHEEVLIMKRFGIWLIAVMLGLVLACGSQEEKKAPAKSGAPPAKAEKVAPVAPPAAPAPAAPQQPKPEHPKAEHPK